MSFLARLELKEVSMEADTVQAGNLSVNMYKPGPQPPIDY